MELHLFSIKQIFIECLEARCWATSLAYNEDKTDAVLAAGECYNPIGGVRKLSITMLIFKVPVQLHCDIK